MLAKITAVLVVLALAVVPSAMGQAAESSGDASGGQTVEMMIIRESSTSPNRDLNLFALENTESAIGRGDTHREVYAALNRLVLVGTQNRAVIRGQLVNNFPDVRREAARQLGLVGTEEARSILLRACLVETDPIVLYEILNSIGGIESEDNTQTVSTIVWVASRFHRAPAPSNHVALAAVNALDSISGRDGGISDPNAFQYLFRVAEGPYVHFVRDRAWEVIDSLRESGDE
ncbi:MAG: HEAT repeat domain-containing protein [Treponema sp.]|nr:HEAT repeat domain-containing protein [Treponema sp.]